MMNNRNIQNNQNYKAHTPQNRSSQSRQPQNRQPQNRQPQNRPQQSRLPQSRQLQSIRGTTPPKTKANTNFALPTKNHKTKSKKRNPTLAGIDAQNPQLRREIRKQERLDPRRLEIERRQKERQQYYLKKKRRRFLRVFLKRLFLLFIATCIFLFSTAIFIFIDFYRIPKNEFPDITYKIGQNTVLAPAAIATKDGVLMINFYDIAALCSLTITGSADRIKFSVLDESGQETEYLRFFSDTDIVNVNGITTRISAPSRLVAERLWVPADFVANAIKGISLNIDTEGNILTLRRIELNSSTPSNPKYEAISFIYKNSPAITPVDESLIIGFESIEFTTDLSQYEKYMNPAASGEFLLLANKDNPLGENYSPTDLVEVPNSNEKYLKEYAAMSLEALFLEAQASGVGTFQVVTAYRTYAEQKFIFDIYLNREMTENNLSAKDAAAAVAKYAMPAGASDHQTALSVDMTSQAALNHNFAETKQFEWLSENAHKFGFVLRYPKEKEHITAVTFEPWHFRYVGRYHATRMHELNLCLEEYLLTLPNN